MVTRGPELVTQRWRVALPALFIQDRKRQPQVEIHCAGVGPQQCRRVILIHQEVRHQATHHHDLIAQITHLREDVETGAGDDVQLVAGVSV